MNAKPTFAVSRQPMAVDTYDCPRCGKEYERVSIEDQRHPQDGQDDFICFACARIRMERVRTGVEPMPLPKEHAVAPVHNRPLPPLPELKGPEIVPPVPKKKEHPMKARARYWDDYRARKRKRIENEEQTTGQGRLF
jgi:hypothetical protein